MINVFLVNDQEAVVGFGEVFEFDGCVLLIVFFEIGFELFGDVAGEWLRIFDLKI